MRDPEVLTRPAPPPDLTVAYGPHPDHVIDLRLPAATRPSPSVLIVVLHGGFWRAEYDRAHTGPMASALAKAGYMVAIPEFRRTGQPGGGWPGTFDDVAAALDALPRLLAESTAGGAVPRGPQRAAAELVPARSGAQGRTANGVAFDRVVLVGHSAGGHLALWAAARHRLDRGSPWHRTGSRAEPGAVVGLAAMADLELCSRWNLGEGAVHDLLGGPPRQYPSRYAVADPAGLVPLGVPVTLVHGSRDDRVPIAMSLEYAERARAIGDEVDVVELPATDHFAVIDPLSDVWPRVLAVIAERSDTSK